MSELTPDEFWLALSPIPRQPDPEFRLYYGQQGEPLFYSMENCPGNYIKIDRETFVTSATNICVIDGKMVTIKNRPVHKLIPGVTGTPCDMQNVTVVVDKTKPHTNWMYK